MNIRLRDASVDDVDSIALVHVRSWAKAYSGLLPQTFIESYTLERRQQLWNDVLSNTLTVVIVAEINDEVVGFLSYRMPRDDQTGEVVELNSLYVAPLLYGQGIGSCLFKHFVHQITESEYKEIVVWALDTNYLALNFYQNRGFIETGRKGKQRADGMVLNDIQMVKPITS